jgi:hypothetical protein
MRKILETIGLIKAPQSIGKNRQKDYLILIRPYVTIKEYNLGSDVLLSENTESLALDQAEILLLQNQKRLNDTRSELEQLISWILL